MLLIRSISDNINNLVNPPITLDNASNLCKVILHDTIDYTNPVCNIASVKPVTKVIYLSNSSFSSPSIPFR